MDMLRITGLKKKFKDRSIIDGLDLVVPKHCILGFIGENGAGKTTTMKMVLGLLKPDAGEIYVNNEKVIYGQTKTNQYIGYLPDVPEFYDFMTPTEYLTFCGEITGLEKTEIKERIDELLKLVGLNDETHRIKGFSRGMKQRLGIAQALLGKPKLLICDEPTSALDPIGRKEILDILKQVSKETTVIFSTHVLSDVERICTDVALLHHGVICMQKDILSIKSSNRKQEYRLELEDGVEDLMQAFDGMERIDDHNLRFCERNGELYTVLAWIVEKKVPLIKIEKLEPSLENLFMEVVQA